MCISVSVETQLQPQYPFLHTKCGHVYCGLEYTNAFYFPLRYTIRFSVEGSLTCVEGRCTFVADTQCLLLPLLINSRDILLINSFLHLLLMKVTNS